MFVLVRNFWLAIPLLVDLNKILKKNGKEYYIKIWKTFWFPFLKSMRKITWKSQNQGAPEYRNIRFVTFHKKANLRRISIQLRRLIRTWWRPWNTSNKCSTQSPISAPAHSPILMTGKFKKLAGKFKIKSK